MKVYLGPYSPHWSTQNAEDSYLAMMHKVEYGWQVEEEEYTKLDKAVIWLIDKWQDVLNLTINKYFAWKSRKIKVRIDYYDVWSADHTLAYIIHPVLLKLREVKHGSPLVDDEDVPDHLKSTAAPPKENEYDTDDNHHDRWGWVLDEMIWAFSQILDDNADAQFHTGKSDIKWEDTEINGKKMYEMVRGPEDTHEFDREGYDKWNARISNGLILFGKYYRGLWD
jgi:hypothetical protein